MFNFNNKNQKYVCGCGTGLNDMFSMVAFVINALRILDIDLKNFYFFHGPRPEIVYENLNKYLNFREINYIDRKEYEANKEDYIMLPSQPSGSTNLNWGTSYHLRNFVSYNTEIINEAKQYVCPIAVHFRCMGLEAYHKDVTKQLAIDEELDRYKKAFLKIYDKNNRYFCTSDSVAMNNFFASFPNVKYIKKEINPAIVENRNKYTKEAILDLACLSLSNFVYFTRGKYTELALALNEKITQTPLDLHREGSLYRKILSY